MPMGACQADSDGDWRREPRGGGGIERKAGSQDRKGTIDLALLTLFMAP